MKKGIIPIYIAVVLHHFKKYVVIKNRNDEVKITTELLNNINELVPAAGFELTLEETLMLQALWLNAERVDWAVYERLRLRVLAWPAPASAAADGRKK
jgi:hypothetical protein